MSITVVKENSITYHIDGDGVLKHMSNNGDRNRTVTIKRNLHSGYTINALGRAFLYHGEFEGVIISDEFTDIRDEAFAHSHVEKVQWSSGCGRIPAGCFIKSDIKELTNTDHIKSVCRDAFYSSKIESFRWPTNCKKIPACCFQYSALNSITNTDNVSRINERAFSFCNVSEFVWPSGCLCIPEGCFAGSALSKISNLQNIHSIAKEAFVETLLSKLDLSDSSVEFISKNALQGIGKKNIILPYYFDGSELIF